VVLAELWGGLSKKTWSKEIIEKVQKKRERGILESGRGEAKMRKRRK
jgi:hypothetical protein